MDPFIAIAGFLTVAVITPGPNNFIVLRVAARNGLMAAVRPIAGIVVGSLSLFIVAWLGANQLLTAFPQLRIFVAAAGAATLAFLGGRMIWLAVVEKQVSPQRNTGAGRLPDGGVTALAAFQFVNPKAWVLVLTASAASPETLVGFLSLAALFVVVPGVCLSLWAAAGGALSGWLQRPERARLFDAVLGGLLILCAALFFT